MIVEIIGVTGSGKSVIVNEVITQLRKKGMINVELSSAYFSRRHCFGSIQSQKFSSFLVDIASFPWFLKSFRKYRLFLRFAISEVYHYADSFFYATNVTRNIIKRIGIYEFLDKNKSTDTLLISDEGLVQQAHGIFVHIHSRPNEAEVLKFAEMVELPDLIIYVRTSPEKIKDRIFYRGHQRIRQLSNESITKFTENALVVFNLLTRAERINKIIFSIDNVEVGPEAIISTAENVTNYIISRIKDAQYC